MTFNPFFPPSQLDLAFKAWHSCGLVFLRDLYEGQIFQHFEALCAHFNLPKQHYFRYLQVRTFASKNYTLSMATARMEHVEKILQVNPNKKGVCSSIYKIIQNICPTSWDITKTKWEEDLQIDIPEDIWEQCIALINTSSLCVKMNLIQFKVFHRLHLSNDKLAKMYTTVRPECPRCHMAVSLGHMFWYCSHLHQFWTCIFNSISYICGKELHGNPITGIFGVLSSEENLSYSHKRAIAFATLVARRCILRNWKAKKPPSFSQWLQDMVYFIKMEKIRSDLYETPDKYEETWSPFMRHMIDLPNCSVLCL